MAVHGAVGKGGGFAHAAILSARTIFATAARKALCVGMGIGSKTLLRWSVIFHLMGRSRKNTPAAVQSSGGAKVGARGIKRRVGLGVRFAGVPPALILKAEGRGADEPCKVDACAAEQHGGNGERDHAARPWGVESESQKSPGKVTPRSAARRAMACLRFHGIDRPASFQFATTLELMPSASATALTPPSSSMS